MDGDILCIKGLRYMKKNCKEFAEESSVEYNTTKTVWVIFNWWIIANKPDIQLCGSTLKVGNMKHLQGNKNKYDEERHYTVNTGFWKKQ